MNDRKVPVSEVAELLGVTPEAIKKWVRELYPESIQNGIQTMLDEQQITNIKQRMLPTTQVVGVVTDLEMQIKAAEVMQWMSGKIADMQTQLAAQKPKVEAFESLMRSNRNMSITEAAKHFGLHPKTEVFPFLREKKYLTGRDLPSQTALDDEILELKQTDCPDGTVRSQAVVPARALDKWRKVLVPKIRSWHEKVGAR